MADMSLLPTQQLPGLGVWFTRMEEVAKFMNKGEFGLAFYIISVQNDADLRKSEKKIFNWYCVKC
jgi:hypothetical protein